MHEISLVQGLFEQIEELAAEHKATKVISVTMEIGPFCGVVVDSFQFGFDILSSETDLLRGAVLNISYPELAYTCTGCGHIVTTEKGQPEACPKCDDTFLVAVGGEDLILQQVEME